ncbi:NAD(P)-binding protein [Pluteus cervinus]|uniref:NAD(P)-binding protein n=1 Tax=Pluteus cervinus TaxID=181527 RepID=A0ACD3AH81_9AGAR|nr:NAD(P)-binding protein [Pluteus cervinus]
MSQSEKEKPAKSKGVVASVMKRLRPGRRSSRKASLNAANGSLVPTTSLEGKVAVVTGSSKSLGAILARCLAEQGADIVVNYVRDSKSADEVVNSIRALNKGRVLAVAADASTVEGGRVLLNETLRVFGRIDILVLNAGSSVTRSLSEIDEEFWDSQMAMNVKAPLFLAKAASTFLPPFGGRIIFISSSLTTMSGVPPNALSYIASKGAIEQISRALAKDLGSRGVTVNSICPGPIDSSRGSTNTGDLGKSGYQPLDAITKQAPLNRLTTPEDIAPIVAFLASPAAQWVNGQSIRVNGGAVV